MGRVAQHLPWAVLTVGQARSYLASPECSPPAVVAVHWVVTHEHLSFAEPPPRRTPTGSWWRDSLMAYYR